MSIASFFHDRSAVAWVIVAAYFLGAMAAWLASRAGRRRERWFWTGAALLLVMLGFNKELDFQSHLTNWGRSFARHLGFFDYRREIQGIFLLVLGGLAVLATVTLLAWLRRASAPVKTAALGVGVLMAFIIIRAASFHHIDHWVTVDIAGMRTGWWLELAGIAVIGISALAYGRRRTKSR